MVEAARILPTLMANDSRLSRALLPVANQFSYIIIDTPPTTGDLLINALVAANPCIDTSRNKLFGCIWIA
jgi:cellulose biosynthesis protein BcsQ